MGVLHRGLWTHWELRGRRVRFSLLSSAGGCNAIILYCCAIALIAGRLFTSLSQNKTPVGVKGTARLPPSQSQPQSRPRSQSRSQLLLASSSSSSSSSLSSSCSSSLPPPPPPQPMSEPTGKANMKGSGPGPGPGPGLISISPGQVVALVRDARKKSLKAIGDDEARGADPDGLPKPGLTLDLTSKNITALPDEVVDILRDGVERLALSHNSLTLLPLRFSQCTSLRYLAARNNAFEVFPMELCDLTSLEFLDLGRNKLKTIPPEISRLLSLRAFALQDNRIESLPRTLADMPLLQRLRLQGNDAIKFPPPEVFRVPSPDVPQNEVEIMVTNQIKRFLKQTAQPQTAEGTSESDAGDDESSEGANTPRLQNRRATGRFPIRVARGSSDVASPPVSRSPSLSRPPPIPGIPVIPGRSHFRGFSQHSNASTRKPGIIPLRSTESLRSNPELARPAQDAPQPGSGSSRRPSAAAVLDEPSRAVDTVPDKPNLNRFSNHLRGFSHTGGLTLTNPFSPEDPSLQRPLYVRELSALPVRRYESQAVDPVLEVAKGILYSIFQIHVGVQTLMSLTNDGTAKRSSLEMVFYNTNVYFEELEQAIQDFDLSSGTRGAAREHEGMQNAYKTLINAYVHICSRLIKSVDLLVDNGDQRYMRTFLMLVYHSIMELRVAMSAWLASPEGASANTTTNDPEPNPATLKLRQRNAPTAAPPIPETGRLEFNERKLGNTPRRLMQVRTDIPYTEATRGRETVLQPPTTTSTPPSDDFFTSAVSETSSTNSLNTTINAITGSSSSNHTTTASRSSSSSSKTTTTTTQQPDSLTSDADKDFESFFVSLKTASSLMANILPTLNALFVNGLRQARSEPAARKWEQLMRRGEAVFRQNELLVARLATLRLRDPGLASRSSPFWALCSSLFAEWAALGEQIKLALVERLVVRFSPEINEGLRLISRSMKDSIDLMVVVRRAAVGGSVSSVSSVSSGREFTGSPVARAENTVGENNRGKWRGRGRGRGGGGAGVIRQQSLPMTPQSAALGPAVRATKPFIFPPAAAAMAAAFSSP
ncbi:RAM signaling pathway protein-domain-containing protein [Podospora appendiculata]|uniref:RAM signaling pathway protein-domain-containing protein n=1 Tax=Podospora appendiculata TaxID=314037 RepID=A0AAE0XIF6_9PEZI|nr:RAM signaling pathway protein-domain-containing protein [Podospora appendiculata]